MTFRVLAMLSVIIGLAACSFEPEAADLFCAEHRCDIMPLALAHVESAPGLVGKVVDELRASTGLDFIEDAFGVPVTFVDAFTRSLGPGDEDSCAYTYTTRWNGHVLNSEIELLNDMPEGCTMPLWMDLLHESIHAFAPNARHTESGVFSDTGTLELGLDAQARAILCDGHLGQCK